MANFSALKTAIQNAIKQNGNEEITGDVLQQILLSMVSTMGDGAINTIEQNLSNETTTRQGADTQLQNAINAIKNNIDNGYVYAGIATPSSTPVSGKVFYIATAAGTYTNFGGQVLTQGINILRYNGSAWSNQQLIGIDDVPTAGSNSLVKSGGVQNELALGAVYDVSAKNPTGGPNSDGKWESLSALLSDANLNTLIPTAYRKGGMSIKFVHTSDNKYIQARCMAQNFTTDVTQWQGVDNEPTAGSKNFVESGGVYPLTRLYNAPKIGLGSFEDGYALFFNGTSAVKQASSGSSITQFSVVGGRKIHLENFNAAGNRSICVYDSNDSLIDCIIYQSSNTSIDYILPVNADYVIATVNTANKSQFYAEYVYPITEDLQKIKSDVDAKYNSVEAEIDDLYERELSLGTIIQGKYVVWYGAATPVNGTEVEDSGCTCTDFIPVKTGFKVKMSGLWLKDNRSVCAYNKNKQFVEGVIRNTQIVSEYEYIVPSGVAYIRMSGKVGQDLSAVYIDHPITKDIERLEKEIDLSFGNIYGKKWLFLGDSITHESFKTDHPEYGWVTHFQNYVKAAKIVNVSVDGAHWKDYADTGDYDGNPQYANLSQNVIGNQCEKIIRGKDTTNPNYSYVEDYQDFDFIIVAAGTNDGNTTADDTTHFDEQFGHYENGEWIKTPLANVNRQLFPGIMRYVYEKFITLYPNARIFYCTPVQAFYGRRTYEGIMNIGDMLKKTCSRLSDVTAIDTEKCGIYGNFELDEEMGRDLYDGLHTNENGGKKIAKYNYCAIKNSVSGY